MEEEHSLLTVFAFQSNCCTFWSAASQVAEHHLRMGTRGKAFFLVACTCTNFNFCFSKLPCLNLRACFHFLSPVQLGRGVVEQLSGQAPGVQQWSTHLNQELCKI